MFLASIQKMGENVNMGRERAGKREEKEESKKP